MQSAPGTEELWANRVRGRGPVPRPGASSSPSTASQRSINKSLLTGVMGRVPSAPPTSQDLSLGGIHSILVKKNPQTNRPSGHCVNRHGQLCPGVSSCVCSHVRVCTAMSRSAWVFPGASRRSQLCPQPRLSVHSSSELCPSVHRCCCSMSRCAQLCPGISRCPPRCVLVHTAVPRCAPRCSQLWPPPSPALSLFPNPRGL